MDIKLTHGETLIIAGFPGIGKKYFIDNSDYIPTAKNLTVHYIDCMFYKWVTNWSWVNNDYPNNYIHEIKKWIGRVDILLVDGYPDIIQTLKSLDIKHLVIIPINYDKSDYIRSYGLKDQKLQAFMDHNWTEIIDSIRAAVDTSKLYILPSGEKLSDTVWIDAPSLKFSQCVENPNNYNTMSLDDIVERFECRDQLIELCGTMPKYISIHIVPLALSDPNVLDTIKLKNSSSFGVDNEYGIAGFHYAQQDMILYVRAFMK